MRKYKIIFCLIKNKIHIFLHLAAQKTSHNFRHEIVARFYGNKWFHCAFLAYMSGFMPVITVTQPSLSGESSLDFGTKTFIFILCVFSLL